MSSTSIKRGRSREDIISNLPTDVIYCILGKMPIRDIIRTNVLSKKWRFYYLNIPELVFDEEFCKELKDIARKKSRVYQFDEYREYMNQFDKIVTKSLMLHLGRIERFKVCIPDFKSGRRVLDVLDVNKWILYLFSKNIKKLTLKHKDKHTEHLRLPPYFFSCLDLMYLKLQNFVLSPPPDFKGFHNIEQLTLIEVDLPNICFESILFGCPILERLELHWCSGIHHFNISGSNLKRLHIKDDDEFESICLADAPNLTQAFAVLG
ncbi:F-box/FBD/LRR-repeat protein At1g13570-like [Nicotiana tabacum]|uniref:F-box/FBD/LRR-repeat protein At1g13570-like n=3 Tax=Nicotiana TaxID=4085 RepID=A0AC58T5N0_TOBAC|nr:PREDICTED: F-box/FBD/LRR-repeat protein At1g13570-like [Nicotiana sylvestris]